MRTVNPSHISAFTFALVVASTVVGCQPGGRANAAPTARAAIDERAIGELFGRLAEATNVRDFEAFGADVTSDWTYFTSGGSEVELARFAQMISGWTELHIAVTDVRPRLSGDGRLAWATLRGHLIGETDGDATERRLRFTGILHRTDAGWKLRHLQSTIAAESQ
jgi:ketosteroid isomerase-like protein